MGSDFDSIRKVLQPKGELPLVKLSLRDHGYVALQEISEAIDEMENLFPQVKAGITELTPLEKLAIRLLLDSAIKEK